MTTTAFTDGVSLTAAAWFNDTDTVTYAGLTSISGTNTIAATGPASFTAYAINQRWILIPAATNSGATTLNISGKGARNVFCGGAACVGGELVLGLPAVLVDDGTRLHLIGPYSGGLVASGQIKFPATQNPSSDANTLDDYEEGTWTPAIGGTATYTNQIGTYIKVGRLVTVTCRLTINNLGSGSTTTISGLPFAASSIGTNQAGCVSYFSSLAANVIFIACEITNNASTVTFNSIAVSGGTISSPVGIFGNGADILFTIAYRAAA